MNLLNFSVAKHIYLLAFGAFDDRYGIAIWILFGIIFKFLQIHTFFYSCNFHKIHAALRAKRVATANVHHIDVFSKTIGTVTVNQRGFQRVLKVISVRLVFALEKWLRWLITSFCSYQL
jgi:hypothetical protein